MNISFLASWYKKRGPARGVAVFSDCESDRAGVAELLSECELLRSQAHRAGIELDDSAASLEALDQLLPRWRDDEEILPWLGNDAGLYLGTVIVRTRDVPSAPRCRMPSTGTLPAQRLTFDGLPSASVVDVINILRFDACMLRALPPM